MTLQCARVKFLHLYHKYGSEGIHVYHLQRHEEFGFHGIIYAPAVIHKLRVELRC